MACLQNLDAIEHVENSKHRTILLALRDTNATSTEIAEQVGVQISTVYYVARIYLPKGFLHMRKYPPVKLA